MHVSIPIENTIEVINVTEISPLISRCEIKVCYIGENRNRTFISKEVAEEMGRKLPGSPIVGYFNQEDGDFEQHNREVEIKNDKFAIIDTTRPYGFVSTDAKVWFQKFLDDGEIERTYLVTEGYIWTGVYPESERITSQGNNHSMELNKPSVKGTWTGNINSNNRFFIINEAVIEKLCVLGENFEPCFEGSQIKSHFSLEEQFIDFKNTMFSMINDLKQALNEGGSEIPMTEEVKAPATEEVPAVVEEPVVAEEAVATGDEPAVDTPVEGAEDYIKKEDEEEKSEGKSGEEKPEKTEDNSEGTSEEEDKKKKYNLEEVVEYAELLEKYNSLEEKYSALEQENNELAATVEPLKTFKLEKERESKQSMIDSFYMLSEEDKKDVSENIDTYSLEDIEAKLAVICVRNKVNFSLNNEEENPAMTFNLSGIEESDVPAWIKAVKQTASTMKN